MITHITTLNFELTDKIKDLIEKKLAVKLDRLLQSVAPPLRVADINLERLPHGGYKAKFDMLLPGHHQIFAQNEHPVLTTTLTGLKERIEKQLLRYKPQSA